MNTQEQFAEQQLTWYISWIRWDSFESLLISMWLTKEERENIKEEGACVSWLREEEVQEIEAYFSEMA
jgi:hypothetical protein